MERPPAPTPMQRVKALEKEVAALSAQLQKRKKELELARRAAGTRTPRVGISDKHVVNARALRRVPPSHRFTIQEIARMFGVGSSALGRHLGTKQPAKAHAVQVCASALASSLHTQQQQQQIEPSSPPQNLNGSLANEDARDNGTSESQSLQSEAQQQFEALLSAPPIKPVNRMSSSEFETFFRQQLKRRREVLIQLTQDDIREKQQRLEVIQRAQRMRDTQELGDD